jgi:hypothetical protein
VSQPDPARPGRHHHRPWRRLRTGAARALLVAFVVVAAAGVVGGAPGAAASGFVPDRACDAPAMRPLGERPDTVRAPAWWAGAHRTSSPPRPLKATLCPAPAAHLARGWVAAVASTPGAPPAGATRPPSSRGPPA